MKCFMAAILLMPALPVFAQSALTAQTPGLCIPPDRPLLDETSLQQLGLTTGEELARYMNEANAYIFCLEETRKQVSEEVKIYLEQWREAQQQ